jgi:hypothetical protein
LGVRFPAHLTQFLDCLVSIATAKDKPQASQAKDDQKAGAKEEHEN